MAKRKYWVSEKSKQEYLARESRRKKFDSVNKFKDRAPSKPKRVTSNGKKYSRKEYEEYLKSDKWKRKREGALKRAYHKCQVCNFPNNLHVHHRTYENLYKEAAADLTVLCDRCHTVFHKYSILSDIEFD